MTAGPPQPSPTPPPQPSPTPPPQPAQAGGGRCGRSARRAVTQLTDLLAAVAASDDERDALRHGAAHVAAVLGAQVVVVLREGEVIATASSGSGARNPAPGPGTRRPRLEALAALAGREGEVVTLDGLGRLHVSTVGLRAPATRVVVGRAAGPLSAGEVHLIRDLERGFALAMRMSRAARKEQHLREESERQAREKARLLGSLRERSLLLERLTRIQRSISHDAPLQEVFDAITAGAQELLGPDVVGLRLLDPADGMQVLISTCGVTDQMVEQMLRMPVGQGAGGRAMVEGGLVIVEDYRHAQNVHPVLAAEGLESAMAAPVHERGRIVGSLSVASYEPGRRYTSLEQEALLAFAEHASLALTDARTLAELREAQHAKELFLAMVSHELKTPLTVIMGALRTLECRSGALPEDVRRSLLSSAFQRGRDLERLLDRLLQGARAELAAEPVAARLPDLLTRAVQGFESSLRLVWGPVPDITLQVDVEAVTGVLGILLENAVAHAPGDTEVALRARIADGEVLVSVCNAGALPDGAETASLFEPFQRGPDATSSGVGLGLSIAARLARSAGGGIEAASDDGIVRFTLRLPCVEANGDPPDDSPE